MVVNWFLLILATRVVGEVATCVSGFVWDLGETKGLRDIGQSRNVKNKKEVMKRFDHG